MARELTRVFSEPEDTILDPFCGSGTVPLEARIMGRHVYGIDRNPYASLLTKAKLHPPKSVESAIDTAERHLDQIEPEAGNYTESIPQWVSEFFHPKTLSGLAQLFPRLREEDESFLLACLLGILHHQRPGFLSYPASNLRPYLKDKKFPKDEYPERYEYREIRPRLISKIERAYRRFPDFDYSLRRRVIEGDAPTSMSECLNANSVNAIITSPPYMNKLDYGRDNRLRLFFIGVEDHKNLPGTPESKTEYRNFLDEFFIESLRVLKPGGKMVVVLGESQRSGAMVDTSELLISMVQNGSYNFNIQRIFEDQVPVREINSVTSETETIIVLEND